MKPSVSVGNSHPASTAADPREAGNRALPVDRHAPGLPGPVAHAFEHIVVEHDAVLFLPGCRMNAPSDSNQSVLPPWLFSPPRNESVKSCRVSVG